jgi:membrane protease YdiL (CAAX protease family)
MRLIIIRIVTGFAEVRRRALAVRPDVWVATGLSALVLAYGNSISTVDPDVRERFLLWSNLAFLALLLGIAVPWARLSWDELGLRWGAVRSSAAWGAAISVVAMLPVAFIAIAPLVTGDPIEAEGISERSAGELAYFLGFRQPLGTALFEEMTFRGVLYGAWQRVGGARTAVLASAGVFAAWHLVITSRTVAESGVVGAPPAVAAGVVVSLAGLFVGGLIFGWLRWRTGSIAAAAVAHWLIVAAMASAVWLAA